MHTYYLFYFYMAFGQCTSGSVLIGSDFQQKETVTSFPRSFRKLPLQKRQGDSRVTPRKIIEVSQIYFLEFCRSRFVGYSIEPKYRNYTR